MFLSPSNPAWSTRSDRFAEPNRQNPAALLRSDSAENSWNDHEPPLR